MMFRKHVPEWVNEFPVASSRAALVQLAKASKGPFEHPREMNFCLVNLSPGPGLKEIQERLTDQGWRFDVMEQPETPGKIMVTATKDDYVMVEDTFKHDAIFFNRLAEMYDAIYDGWFASN